MIINSRRDFLGAGMAGTAFTAMAGTLRGQDGAQASFTLHPVGTIVNKPGQPVQLQITEKYVPALKGLESWSHVVVVYWFDKNDTPQKRSILQVHPRGNPENPLTGVFACRSPVRPNLIALSTCKILSVKAGGVTVDSIDAFDGTPILDLKPFVAYLDNPTRDFAAPDWTKGEGKAKE